MTTSSRSCNVPVVAQVGSDPPRDTKGATAQERRCCVISQITQSLKIIKPKANPSALAERHANALGKYREERNAIIDEGTRKVQEIQALRKELDAEEDQHRTVLNSIKNINL